MNGLQNLKGRRPQDDVIITPLIKQYLIKSFQFGSILGGHPFKWDEVLQRSAMGSRRQRFHFGVNMFLGFAYVVFLVVRCVEVSFDESSTNGQRIHMRFMLTFYLLAAVIYYVVIGKGEEFICYINQYLATVKQFEKDFVEATARTPIFIKVIGLVMQQLFWLLNAFIPLMVLTAVTNPESYDQFSSLIPDPTGMTISTRIAFAMMAAYRQYIYSSCANVVVVGGFCGLFMYLFLLGELVPGESTITSRTLRQHKQMLVMYRRVQFQVILHQSMYNQIIPAAKLLMMLWGIYCTYGAIRTNGLSSLAFGFVAAFSFGYLAVLFTYLAELQVRSSRAKRYWNSQPIADRFIAKSLGSLQDITFKLRGFYLVDRAMILTMLNTMIEETVTFLLLNR